MVTWDYGTNFGFWLLLENRSTQSFGNMGYHFHQLQGKFEVIFCNLAYLRLFFCMVKGGYAGLPHCVTWRVVTALKHHSSTGTSWKPSTKFSMLSKPQSLLGRPLVSTGPILLRVDTCFEGIKRKNQLRLMSKMLCFGVPSAGV